MGKYMKKSKRAIGESAPDLSQSPLGVRTRAKSLALLKSLPAPAPASGDSYLQLRSRRLEKPQIPVANKIPKQSRLANPNPSSIPKPSSIPNPNPRVAKEEMIEENKKESVDLAVEDSFGENLLEFEGRERSTRETTPCSLIKDPDAVRTPGSTTRRSSSIEANRRVQNSMRRHFPTAKELKEFFAAAEKEQHRRFMEKYNFDFAEETPLPGRYEWVKVNP